MNNFYHLKVLFAILQNDYILNLPFAFTITFWSRDSILSSGWYCHCHRQHRIRANVIPEGTCGAPAVFPVASLGTATISSALIPKSHDNHTYLRPVVMGQVQLGLVTSTQVISYMVTFVFSL